MQQNKLIQEVLNDPKYADHRKAILQNFKPLTEDQAFPVYFRTYLEECVPDDPKSTDHYSLLDDDNDLDLLNQLYGTSEDTDFYYYFKIQDSAGLHHLITRLCQTIKEYETHSQFQPGDDGCMDIYAAIDAIHDLKEYEKLMVFKL